MLSLQNQPLGSLESQDSSHYSGEAEVAKQDSYTVVADANDLNVSKQAEIDSMKVLCYALRIFCQYRYFVCWQDLPFPQNYHAYAD